MFPHRASEGDRTTLPPISSLSSHESADTGRAEPHARETGPRFPMRADGAVRERPPPPASEHRQTPPTGLLQRPPQQQQQQQQQQREMEPLRAGAYPRLDDEPYGPRPNSRMQHHVPPPPPFHRDLERGTPPTDEGAWRSYDRPDPRFGAKDPYSPNMQPAPYGSRDDARSAPWQRPSDDPHRPRMQATPVGMRDDGSWRPGAASRDRPDLHPDAFAHERPREEDRWHGERPPRPMYPYENGPGFAGVPPYPHDARSAGRTLDADPAEASRRIRRRATTSLMEEEQMAPRHPPAGARPYRPETYSPPELRSHSADPNRPPSRPGMMVGMEPPRPSSTLGVMPGASAAAAVSSAGAPPASTTTNTVNANRRVAHLLSEQKRRESINTGFEELRQAIPACRDGQDSKATILKRALEYIRELESVVERQHRPSLEGHVFGGGYSNRSPPDDKDDVRRFGRPGGDEDRRGASGGRQLTGGSSSSSGSDAGNAPRIGGLPSTAFTSAPHVYGAASTSASAPHRMREYRDYGSPHLSPPNVDGEQAEVNARAVNGCDDVRGPSAAKRWADDSDDDQRSPSRRRVSDSDKDGVMHHAPAGAHYLIARPPPVAHSRSPLQRSPKLEPPPRDWQARLKSKSLVDSAVRV
ncbi:hypothetical protein EX895_002270 [Sporisorium graminicola]|uniref:BHLH domain-containing protein n=1 Tax=Sporisorium graminicola TaxID=280036 RepID=A0A4V6EU05_9BASI|nr:hypothetical protein EX895_002270 [Sporisorium graminicola]TKY88639.1 hypothetical protein EX895_002270 [Sporisorium graminicola]